MILMLINYIKDRTFFFFFNFRKESARLFHRTCEKVGKIRTAQNRHHKCSLLNKSSLLTLGKSPEKQLEEDVTQSGIKKYIEQTFVINILQSAEKKGGAGGNILRGEKAEWVKWSRLSLSTDLVFTHWHAGRARSMPSILVTPPPRPPQSPGCWMTSQTS